MTIKSLFSLFRFFTRTSFRSSRPEVFFKKGVLRNFTKFTGKHLCQSQKFLRTPFCIEHHWWLLLKICYECYSTFTITRKKFSGLQLESVTREIITEAAQMMLNVNKKVLYEKSRSKVDFVETGCTVIAYLFPEAALHRCSQEKVF